MGGTETTQEEGAERQGCPRFECPEDAFGDDTGLCSEVTHLVRLDTLYKLCPRRHRAPVSKGGLARHPPAPRATVHAASRACHTPW